MSTPAGAADLRRQLGAAAVLSETEAVRLLPVRHDVARAWLRGRKLVRDVPGLADGLVVWADVVDEIRLGGLPAGEPPAAAPPAKLRRAGIVARKRGV